MEIPVIQRLELQENTYLIAIHEPKSEHLGCVSPAYNFRFVFEHTSPDT